jgi:hypothetical protein
MQAKSKTIQYLETLPEWFAEQVVKRELSPTDYLMALATLYNQTGMHSLEYKTIKFLCDLQPDYLPAIKREKSLSETLKLQKEAKN